MTTRVRGLSAVLGGWLVGLAVGCGGGADEGGDDGMAMCGAMVCGVNEVCDDTGQFPSCVCEMGYTGTDCLECDAGYELVGEQCQPIAIDCEDNPCGLNGVCVSEEGQPDRCECSVGYGGPTCAQCASGYQDNDADGSCQLGCDGDGAPVCDAPLVCRDDAGAATCGCPFGTTGDACELCESGRARRGDGECYLTCASPDFECLDPQYCFDDDGLQPATCVCPLGTTGEGCTTCAEGFTRQGEACAREAPSGAEFLTLAVNQGRTTVAALEASDGSVTPLREASSLEGLVWVPSRGELFGASLQGVTTVDLVTGVVEVLAALQIGHGKPIAWDTSANRLLTLRASDYVLVAVDPDSGSTTELGSTGVSWVWDATYDETSGDLVLVRSQGSTPTIHAVDPATAVATELGTLTGLSSAESAAPPGIAMQGGDLHVLSVRNFTPEEVFFERCRRTADRLGYDGYGDATITSYVMGTGPGALTLESQATGKEIVAYYTYGGPGTTLTIAVDNPEAFVCIATYQDALNLVVDPGASWAGGVVFPYNSAATAEVPVGFTTANRLVLSGGTNAVLDDAAAETAVFRLMTGQEWSDRRLESLTTLEAYALYRRPFDLHRFTYPELVFVEETPVAARIRSGLTAR